MKFLVENSTSSLLILSYQIKGSAKVNKCFYPASNGITLLYRASMFSVLY